GQAKKLAQNVIATMRGRPMSQYRHTNAGSVASLGLYQGVAQIYDVKLCGFGAWFLHRTYHLATMPTLHRKARIAADWALSLPFRRQVVATEEQHEPREQFVYASEAGRGTRGAGPGPGAHRDERAVRRPQPAAGRREERRGPRVPALRLPPLRAVVFQGGQRGLTSDAYAAVRRARQDDGRLRLAYLRGRV